MHRGEQNERWLLDSCEFGQTFRSPEHILAQEMHLESSDVLGGSAPNMIDFLFDFLLQCRVLEMVHITEK